MSQLGDLGSGAGKGGGGGGSIREAGGAFGKMEAAREEEFFYKQVKFCYLEFKELATFIVIERLLYSKKYKQMQMCTHV